MQPGIRNLKDGVPSFLRASNFKGTHSLKCLPSRRRSQKCLGRHGGHGCSSRCLAANKRVSFPSSDLFAWRLRFLSFSHDSFALDPSHCSMYSASVARCSRQFCCLSPPKRYTLCYGFGFCLQELPASSVRPRVSTSGWKARERPRRRIGKFCA